MGAFLDQNANNKGDMLYSMYRKHLWQRGKRSRCFGTRWPSIIGGLDMTSINLNTCPNTLENPKPYLWQHWQGKISIRCASSCTASSVQLSCPASWPHAPVMSLDNDDKRVGTSSVTQSNLFVRQSERSDFLFMNKYYYDQPFRIKMHYFF